MQKITVDVKKMCAKSRDRGQHKDRNTEGRVGKRLGEEVVTQPFELVYG